MKLAQKTSAKPGGFTFSKGSVGQIGGMKPVLPLLVLAAAVGSMPAAFGHDSVTGEEHPIYDPSVQPPAFFLAQATPPSIHPAAPASSAARPAQAAAFTAFAPLVKVRWDERTLFVESNGMPAHNLMVGITAWQQQVP